MLEVNSTDRTERAAKRKGLLSPPTQGAAKGAWPASLYATPRVAGWVAPPQNETFIAEDILDGCRSAVQQLDLEDLTSLGITSSIRGEGRTTIALATSLVLAEYGLDVVLVELDFRHPELAQRLTISKSPGIGDVAEGRAGLQDAMHSVSTGLAVIPAGQLHGSVPRALRELASSSVINALTAQGHVVVADLGPLLGDSAGRLAVSLVAELVLVVRANMVQASSIKQAVEGLSVTPNVILNGLHSNVPSWALRLSGL